jgi:hypothetical protein
MTLHVLSVELQNLWAKVIHAAHRLRMGSSAIDRYFASQEFRVTPALIRMPGRLNSQAPCEYFHPITMLDSLFN